MASIEIQKELRDAGTRSVNFFDGRILSGDDLSNEQAVNREEHRQLGAAIGDGIVAGLEVVLSKANNANIAPTVTVKAGTAINRAGQLLALPGDIDVLLDNLPNLPPASTSTMPFAGASPVNGGAYVLVLSPVREHEGFSLTSSTGASARAYKAAYFIDTVEFRLLPLGLDRELFNDPDHLQNTIAYLCFGFSDANAQPFQSNPYGTLIRSSALLDTYRPRKLADSDVPLAVLYLTATDGIKFIDLWSVRRRVVHPAASNEWGGVLNDERRAEAEAMFLQFQQQVTDIHNLVNATGSSQKPPLTPKLLAASRYLNYLPPAGYLPVDARGFDWNTFLGPLAPRFLTSVDAGLLRSLLQASLYRDPIKVVAEGSNEALAPVDVYQDPSQPDWVLFARTTSNRLNVTVEATGFQPAQIAVKLGPQTQLTIPLKPSQPMYSQQPQQAQQGQQVQPGERPLVIKVTDIKEPALQEVYLTMLLRAVEIPSERLNSMVRVEQVTEDANVTMWLGNWADWLNGQYPSLNVIGVPPAIYMHPYFNPRNIADEPQAYAVFNTVAIPLLVNLPSRRLPRPVALSRSGIPGLGDDIAQALEDYGFSSVDQLAGAWSQAIVAATGLSSDYGRYLIRDAIAAIAEIRTQRRYYSGMNAKTAEILQEMAIADDVGLANADPEALGNQIKSRSFAASLIEQARAIVPQSSWDLDSLGLKPEQITALNSQGIYSKGEFVLKVDPESGRDKIATLLKMTSQQIADLHSTAITQITADSIKQVQTTDLTLLPDIDAVIASKLADSDITTVDEMAKVNPDELARSTGISEETLETLKKDATEASRESMEVERVATITREVASELDRLGVNTIANLDEQTEERVAGAFRGVTRVTRAVLEGIRAALSGRPRPLE